MSLGWYSVDINSADEGLDPLLPHIAGVIENMEEATIGAIQREVEQDLNEKVSRVTIMNALENGVKLGLFDIEREFKVCKEFTSKEIKKVNKAANIMMLPKSTGLSESFKQRKTLMDYVKMQRKKRRKKMFKAKAGKQSVLASGFSGRKEIYSQLCQRCRKSIEKKMVRCSGSESELSSTEDYGDKKSVSFAPSSSQISTTSQVSNANSRSSENDRKAPQKSRLLVERNPMETDPPYCDIFT